MGDEARRTVARVAVIQEPPVFLNLQASLEKACSLITGAALGQEADLVVFPETWLPGYPVWLDASPNAALWDYPPARALYRLLAENSVAIPGKHLNTLLDIARSTDTYVVMGVHERLGGTLYNTMVFIHKDGKQFKVHRKLVPTYTERLVWGRGDGGTLSVLETEWGNLGGLICWEHWMPLARAAIHAKKEIIHVAQWPWVRGLHQLASRHYAFEGQCFVLATGCVLSKGDVLAGLDSLGVKEIEARALLEALPGGEEDLLMKGGSAVIGPDYRYVVEPLWEEAGIVSADLRLERVTEGLMLLDTDGHYSRPDVFRLEVNEQPQANVTFTMPDEGAGAGPGVE
jgi:nitrilase